MNLTFGAVGNWNKEKRIMKARKTHGWRKTDLPDGFDHYPEAGKPNCPSHSDTLDAKIWQTEVWGMQPDSKTGKRRHREAARTSADEKTLDQSKDLFEGKTEGFIPNRLAVCS